jgi:hypothetical protein
MWTLYLGEQGCEGFDIHVSVYHDIICENDKQDATV